MTRPLPEFLRTGILIGLSEAAGLVVVVVVDALEFFDRFDVAVGVLQIEPVEWYPQVHEMRVVQRDLGLSVELVRLNSPWRSEREAPSPVPRRDQRLRKVVSRGKVGRTS